MIAIVYGDWEPGAAGHRADHRARGATRCRRRSGSTTGGCTSSVSASLQAIEPIVGFVVAIALAVAGAGYWALAVGVVGGGVGRGRDRDLTSQYPLAWRYDRGALRIYIPFGAGLCRDGVAAWFSPTRP